MLFAAVALLLLWRLPDGVADLPAIRPAVAVGLAWLCLSRRWKMRRPPAVIGLVGRPLPVSAR